MDADNSWTLFRRRLPFWVVGLAFIALALVAYSPYLTSGFACDDVIFVNMMEGAIPYNPLTGFWSAPVDQFPGFNQLWWMEASAQGAFLRPLPSWTLELLYHLFGRNAIPYHVTTVAVHGLVAFTAALLLRRLSGRDGPAILAGLLFLICDDHGMTVAWIATITDLMCALFLNLAFLIHVTARQGSRPRLLLLSLVCFLLAMMSKETAAIYPVVVVTYEFVFADRLPEVGGRVSLGRRMRLFVRHAWAWLAPVVVFGAYMAFYRSLVEPMRNLMYLDPFTQPLQYAGATLLNLPVMVTGLLTPIMPSMATMMPALFPAFVGLGLLLLALLLWAVWPFRGERAIWFSLLVFVLTLLPGLATDPGERLLYYPSVFGLFVVAWLVFQIPWLRRWLSPSPAPGIRVLGQVWAWSMLVGVVMVPVVLLFVYPSMWIPGLQLPEKSMLNSLPLIDARNPERVVFVNTNSSFNTFYLPDMYRYHRGRYLDIRFLSSFNGRVSARLVGPQSLELKTEDSGWLDNMFARIVRVTPEFQVGQEAKTPLFTATVQAVTPDGQDVTQVRFDFDLDLDDPSLLFLTWDGHQFVPWQPTRHWQLLNESVDPWAL